MTTCEWPTTPLYQDYHDYEWGRPIHDDQHQFEHLCLESLQCGLSWLTILNKRSIVLKLKLLSIMLLLLNVFNLNLVRSATIFGDLPIIKRLFMKTIQKVISLQRMVYLRGLAKT